MHYSAIDGSGVKPLDEGELVTCEVTHGKKVTQTENVSIARVMHP